MAQAVIDALTGAYFAEIETVMNYIANGENLDGVRARRVAEELKVDVGEELAHAQQIAARIKTIGGAVPGSEAFKAAQKTLQPPEDTTDVVTVIKGVIDAEESAIAGYRDVIKAAQDADDYATEDMAIAIMADEEQHRRAFIGYLKEYESGR